MRKLHAHIYFTKPELEKAEALFQLASLESTFHAVKLYDRPVGPHPLPMFELHFVEKNKEKALLWLKSQGQAFSILVHIDSGDDIQDHTQETIWLGAPLKLDFNFFDLVAKNPSLAIHPKS